MRSRDLSLNIVHVVISPFDFPLKNEKYMEKSAYVVAACPNSRVSVY